MAGKTKFIELKDIYAKLHSPEGCAWDKEQTYKSLLPYLREEVDELIAAVESGKAEDIKEELGDVLLQVMFHAEIASKEGKFDIEDVIDGLIRKIKRRHPHVFGNARVDSVADIRANWNRIKKEEKEK